MSNAGTSSPYSLSANNSGEENNQLVSDSNPGLQAPKRYSKLDNPNQAHPITDLPGHSIGNA
ncbi:hypothetical protein BDQ12DRAFT_678284 [Crucibulum laeve]|uniref:Uncharacterized protein n=1 Tax=Crucibulum laeve TaxID=68775 RepID=A0A5C3MA75_9AGAR|nr:hypothetical protein BDQ12DRAFT_678284 [Crucibulum laeve]